MPFYNSLDSRSGRDWRNVLPITIIPAVLGAIGATVINPNLVTSKYEQRANELEARLVKSLGKLIGFEDVSKIGGLSVEGGTKGNIYGYILGLHKAFPNIKEDGLMSIQQPFMFINSQSGHFSNFTNLAAIGVGRKNSIRVKANSNSSMDTDHFKTILEDCFKKNIVVPTVLITGGSTDATALDNIIEVNKHIDGLCKQYPNALRPHIHIDGVIGWALSFYNDYNHEKNEQGFSLSFLNKLQEAQKIIKNFNLADSISIDVHKTGFAPYSSSFLLVKNENDFDYLKWEDDAFKYFNPSEYAISPVSYSLECTRSASGVFATALALKTLGSEGYQTLIGAGLQFADILKNIFMGRGNVAIINKNLSFTALFRPYPLFVQNAQEILELEKNSIEYQATSKQISDYVNKFYDYWTRYKQPETPEVDFVSSAAWAQYDDCTHEISSWKAFMLNPRTGKFIDEFINEFFQIQKEFEARLPKEYLNKIYTAIYQPVSD